MHPAEGGHSVVYIARNRMGVPLPPAVVRVYVWHLRVALIIVGIQPTVVYIAWNRMGVPLLPILPTQEPFLLDRVVCVEGLRDHQRKRPPRTLQKEYA